MPTLARRVRSTFYSNPAPQQPPAQAQSDRDPQELDSELSLLGKNKTDEKAGTHVNVARNKQDKLRERVSFVM